MKTAPAAPPPTPRRELAGFTKRLKSSVPEIGSAIAARIWQEVPSYRALGEELQRDVEDAASRNVDAFVKALAGGKGPARREIDALGVVGAERAAQGLPLEDVLKAFRMVGRVLWDHISEEARVSSISTDYAVFLSGELMRFTDEISSSVAKHYSREQQQIVRREESVRHEFVHDLLLGTFADAASMAERSRSFGLDPSGRHIAVVASTPDKINDDPEAALARAFESVSEKIGIPGRYLADRRDDTLVGLMSIPADVSTETVADEVSAQLPGWKFGFGEPHTGLEGFRRSYHEARDALQIGASVAAERSTHLFQDLILYRIFSMDGAMTDRLIDLVLGKLLEHDRRRRSELIKTLDAYFANGGSVKDAAKDLYAHPHTVSYRLKQIERISERSLADPQDRLHFQTALMGLRVRPPGSAA